MALTLKEIIARRRNTGDSTSDVSVSNVLTRTTDSNRNSDEAVNNNIPNSKIRLTNLVDYYSTGLFNSTLEEFRKNNSRKTGYSNLDAIQKFYPGLYVLGAISSLGKTTFCHQMADQLAATGESVLYFSLEQNVFELFSKSLSRGFYQTWLDNKSDPIFSSIDIRSGVQNEDHFEKFDVQAKNYIQSVSKNLIIAECNFNATVEDIQSLVENFMNESGKKPIVFVDYLQIISPTLINGRPGNSKNNIDHIVHSLKCFQSIHNLVVVVISSLNRQNYMVPIDFESFKESGGIEYTADVVWGLQLAAINDEIFSKEGKIREKREIIRKAKKMNPRIVQLLCIKNRYGISSYTVGFDYYPVYDIFIPLENEDEE